MDKTITVKIKGSGMDPEVKEFEFPSVKQYLEQGYTIANVHQLSTSTPYGVHYIITYHLRKQ